MFASKFPTNHSTPKFSTEIGSATDIYVEIIFLLLMDSNQIFRNDFVIIQYHICKISAQLVSS